MNRSRKLRITSGMGRAIDLRYKSNRYALVVSGLAAIGTALWRLSTSADDPWFWAWRVGVGVFLAWAIARELDPDEPASAVVTPLVLLPFLLLGAPSVAGSVAALMAARIGIRTTGLSPSWFDAILLVGGSAYLGSRLELWPVAVALILAVFADRLLYPSGPSRSLYTAALMTLALLAGVVIWGDAMSWDSPTIGEWVGIVIVFLGVVAAVLMVRPPTSRGDFRKEQLAENRILAARGLVAAVLMAGLFYPGGSIVPSLSPLWAAIVAIPTASWARRRLLRPM